MPTLHVPTAITRAAAVVCVNNYARASLKRRNRVSQWKGGDTAPKNGSGRAMKMPRKPASSSRMSHWKERKVPPTRYTARYSTQLRAHGTVTCEVRKTEAAQGESVQAASTHTAQPRT